MTAEEAAAAAVAEHAACASVLALAGAPASDPHLVDI